MMVLSKFRSQVLYIWLCCRFAVILFIFFHLLQNKFIFEQVKELMFLILPVFAVDFAAAIKNATANGESGISRAGDKQVDRLTIILGKWVPIIFAGYLILVLTFQSAGTTAGNQGFGQMKELIGWAEVIYAFYTGFMLLSLFSASVSTDEEIKATLEKIQQALQSPVRPVSFNGARVDQIKSLIAKGQVQAAIDQLISELEAGNDNNHLTNQVLNLSAQFHLYTQRKRVNITKDDTVFNQVSLGLLEIVDEMRGRS